MSDESRGRGEGIERDMTMYRPSTEGGLEPVTGDGGDYRDRLRSRRWGAAPLENPEVEQTDPRIAIAFLIGFLALTFVVLVIGYGTGFWG